MSVESASSPRLSGVITNAQLPEAELLFPGITAHFAREAQSGTAPQTFLELLVSFGLFPRCPSRSEKPSTEVSR